MLQQSRLASIPSIVHLVGDYTLPEMSAGIIDLRIRVKGTPSKPYVGELEHKEVLLQIASNRRLK